MTTPDYSTWFTKPAAAAALGVRPKTIERLAHSGKLQQATWRNPEPGVPSRVVYHPDDVARLATERQPEASVFVLPPALANDVKNGSRRARPGGLAHRNASGAGLALGPALPASEDQVRTFVAMVRAVMSQTSDTVFLSLAAAATLTGLSPTCLRRMVKDGKLEALRDRGLRFRRRDLGAL